MKAIIPCLFITMLDVVGPMGCYSGSVHPSYPVDENAWAISCDSGATFTTIPDYQPSEYVVPAAGGTYYIRCTNNPEVRLRNIHMEWNDSSDTYTPTSANADSICIPGHCTTTVRGNMARIHFLPADTIKRSYYIDLKTERWGRAFGFIQQGK